LIGLKIMEEFKSVLFVVNLYWELHWLYNVIKAVDGVAFVENSDVKKMCDYFGVRTTNDSSSYKTAIVTNSHLGAKRTAELFFSQGKKVIELQHAWDPALRLKDVFWNYSTNRFSYLLVGSTQDYDWLSSKYGKDRVFLTGIPKLDDLYTVKNSKESLRPIHDEFKLGRFYLSMAPTDAISLSIYMDYEDNLEPMSPIPVVFKVHPGTDFEKTKQADIQHGNVNRVLIEDNMYDLFKTYEIMKESSGVVCLESFMSVEASLLGKPVIFHGYGSIPNDFYGRDENVNQKMRAPYEMSSTLNDPRFTDKQKEIASYYLFDGKNTERTVNKLKELI